MPTQLALVNGDPQRWITVQRAAELSGLTVRAVQLKVQSKAWSGREVVSPKCRRPALMIDRYSGGQELWPREAQRKSESRAFDQLSAQERMAADNKKRWVLQVDAYLGAHHGRKPDADLIEEFRALRRAVGAEAPSASTYWRWRGLLYSSAGSLLPLVDGRKTTARGNVVAEFTPAAWEFFLALYLTTERRRASACYDLLQMEARRYPEWQIPSLKTVLRRIKKLPADLVTEKRPGRKARQDLHDAYLPRDYTKMASNERWVSDHHIFDCFGLDDLPGGDGQPARMWITTWMDERSRYIVSYRVSRCPNSTVVMASFCDGVLQNGVPYGIYVDNGKDYRAQRFAGGRDWRSYKDVFDEPGDDLVHCQGILRELGVTPTFATPYNAKAKLVENWHQKWLCERFSKFTGGYWGNSPQSRPDELALVAKRPKGVHFVGKTFAELQPWSKLLELLESVIQQYNNAAHTGQGMDGRTPAQVYALCQTTPKRIANSSTLRLLLMEKEVRTIGRNGILLGRYFYGTDEPKIMALQGDRVVVRLDAWRADVVYVYDLADRFISTARNWGLADANATHEDLAEVNRTVRRVNKVRRQIREQIAIADAPPIGQIMELQRQRAAAAAAANPLPELSAPEPVTLAGVRPEQPAGDDALAPLGRIYRGGIQAAGQAAMARAEAAGVAPAGALPTSGEDLWKILGDEDTAPRMDTPANDSNQDATAGDPWAVFDLE